MLPLRHLRVLDVRCCDLLSAADVAAFRAARPRTRVDELWARWP